MAVLMFLVPRASGGGAEKVIVSLASAMAEEHTVYLVTTIREDGVETYPFSERVNYLNVYSWAEEAHPAAPAQASPQPVPGGPGTRIRAAIRRRLSFWAKQMPASVVEPVKEQVFKPEQEFQIRTVREMKEALGVDCAVSFLNSANYINVMSRAGERTIVSIRSYPESRYAPADNWTEAGRARIRTVCELADCVVSVAKETADCMAAVYGVPAEKMRVIYNYVDLEDIARRRAEPLADPDLEQTLEKAGFVFVSTGRLTEKKGQWHLIRAFRTVLRTHPDALLVIPGREGKGRDNTAELLHSVIRENGLAGRVLLPGWCPNPYALLARCDAFVETSFNEGFPNALAEAMALGLPVISTDCRSGPREILAPSTDYSVKATAAEVAEFGILVPECSGKHLLAEPLEPEEEILAGAMLSLLEDRDLRDRFREKSLERARQFSKGDTLSQWKALIEGGEGAMEET